MKGNLEKKVAVIIRSVGERTEQLCHELILAQGVPKENIFIIHKSPFSAALRESFSIGIKRDLPWTLCNDADVLLRPNSIAHFIRLIEDAEKNICEIQGYVLDKFFGGPRCGGPHLYRTSLLHMAIDQIPAEGTDIRPEGYLLSSMSDMGFPYKSVRYLTGLHDFEQYYRDIYRKCFVYAHKHQKHTELFLDMWRSGACEDRDFQVALKGYSAGIEHYKDVLIDIRSEIYRTIKDHLQFDEKKQYSLDNDKLYDVEEVIDNWIEPKAYQIHFPTKLGLCPNQERNNKFTVKNIIMKYKKLGFFKFIVHGIGRIFLFLGQKLKSF